MNYQCIDTYGEHTDILKYLGDMSMHYLDEITHTTMKSIVNILCNKIIEDDNYKHSGTTTNISVDVANLIKDYSNIHIVGHISIPNSAVFTHQTEQTTLNKKRIIYENDKNNYIIVTYCLGVLREIQWGTKIDEEFIEHSIKFLCGSMIETVVQTLHGKDILLPEKITGVHTIINKNDDVLSKTYKMYDNTNKL